MTNEMRVSRPRKPGITGGQLVAAYDNSKKSKDGRQITQEERLQWMHGTWKAKQDQVPRSPDDMFCFRDPHGGKEIRMSRSEAVQRLTRSDLSEDRWISHDGSEYYLWINHNGTPYKLLSIVKVTCGEAEKNAKGGD